MSDMLKLCKDIHGFAETLGWDQIPMAMIVDNDDQITHIIGLDGGGKPYTVLMDAVQQKPELAKSIKESKALIMVSEGWTYPKHIMDQIEAGAPMPEQPPSETPGKRELRSVICFSRDDTEAITVMKVRDEAELRTSTSTTGPMIDSLRYLFNDPIMQTSVN